MDDNKLAVAPKVGFDMIGIGTTKGYELINSRELEVFKIGRATRITTESIERFIARRVAETRQAA